MASQSRSRLALLRVAKAALGLGDDDYRAILENYGGSHSATTLDDRGFDAVMNRFRALGFTSDQRRRSYGVRADMASPAQVEMIRALWREAADGDDAHLNAWLAKYQGVGALRFVTASKAAMVIAALKAMKARLETADAD